MVVVVKNGVDKSRQDHLVDWLKSMNIDVHITVGEFETILGLIGGSTAKIFRNAILLSFLSALKPRWIT